MTGRWRLLAAVVILGSFISGAAQAAAPAREFPYTKQTTLVPGAYKFVFSLYASPTAATPLWSSGAVALTLKTPVLVYTLGSGTAKIPATINFAQQLYLKVEKTYPGARLVITNRERLSIAPYALATGNGGDITAVTAGTGLTGGGTTGAVTLGVDTSAIQQRVASECASGNAIRAVGADGSVTCEAVSGGAGDITAVTAGAGLSGGGDTGAVELSADIGTGAGQVASGDHAHGTVYYSKAYVDALEARIAALEAMQTDVAALKTLLAHFSRNGNEVTISGANLRIVSGSGATDGAVNGLGNLIVGYNEPRGDGDDRTGSHNIVAGKGANFPSYGGLVAGTYNAISAPFAVVSGGDHNTASGDHATIAGGRNNEASGVYSHVSGGGSTESFTGNKAYGDYSSILGGFNNLAGDRSLADHGLGNWSTVSGGGSNVASGNSSSVTGGDSNEASERYSSVSGGRYNTAVGRYSAVHGGYYNTATGFDSSVSGGSYNVAGGQYSHVSGGGSIYEGQGNKAFGDLSSILGGTSNIAGDPALTNHTLGAKSTVSGGSGNVASGELSSVSGGGGGIASGESGSIHGGYQNQAGGTYSTAVGGQGNTASGNYSTVVGAP